MAEAVVRYHTHDLLVRPKRFVLALPPVGAVLVVVSTFSIPHTSPVSKSIMLACAVALLVYALLFLKTWVRVEGGMLTVSYAGIKSVDLAKLISVTMSMTTITPNRGLILKDSDGNTVAIMPRLYAKKDMRRVLRIVRPYVPGQLSQASWTVRNTFKSYGVK